MIFIQYSPPIMTGWTGGKSRTKWVGGCYRCCGNVDLQMIQNMSGITKMHQIAYDFSKHFRG